MDYQDGWTYYDDIHELSYEERRAQLFEQCESEQLSCPASQESLVQHTELPQPYQEDTFTPIAEVPWHTEVVEPLAEEPRPRELEHNANSHSYHTCSCNTYLTSKL